MKTVAQALLALVLVAIAIFLGLRVGNGAGDESDHSTKRSGQSKPRQPSDLSTASRPDRSLSHMRKRNPDLPDFLFELDEMVKADSELGELSIEFDPWELIALAAEPPKKDWELAKLICLAAAKKDTNFRYLLDQENLRPRFNLALDVYDYAVNGNEEALQRILEKQAAEPPSSDSSVVVALSYLDEWEHTIPAVLKHFENGADGTGATCRLAFWGRRKALFPTSFDRLLHPK